MREKRELEIIPSLPQVSSNLSQIKQNSKEYSFVCAFVHLNKGIWDKLL